MGMFPLIKFGYKRMMLVTLLAFFNEKGGYESSAKQIKHMCVGCKKLVYGRKSIVLDEMSLLADILGTKGD